MSGGAGWGADSDELAGATRFGHRREGAVLLMSNMDEINRAVAP